ncbi:MAG: hypothetical protein AAGA70_14980 [Pseudomonadota bacterium]
MTPKLPVPGFLSDISMPLRDALRGVASVADVTEDVLAPAAQLLPEPLSSQFRGALGSLESAGKRLIHAPVDHSSVASASQFLTGEDTGRDAMVSAARVVVFAWEHLAEGGDDGPYLISETIAAERLSHYLDAESSGPGAARAARILTDIRNSSAIGRAPGLVKGTTPEGQGKIDLALLAIASWALAKRSATLEEEDVLLDLAMALVRAMRIDTDRTFSDPEYLSGLLTETAAHL